MPVFVVANNSKSLQKMISNVQEIKSRKGQVVLLIEEGQTIPEGLADFIVQLPKANEILSPIIASIPLQLFSYHAAKNRNCNIDQPRNLAKSVTVE